MQDGHQEQEEEEKVRYDEIAVESSDPDEWQVSDEGPVEFYGSNEPDFATIELKDKGTAAVVFKD